VESGFLLDVIIGECPSVLELFACEDEPLLIWGDAFLVLNLLLDVLDGIRTLDFEGDCLAGQGLDEDLHASPEPEDQVESGLLLNVVVSECPAVLELFASEDEPLLIGGNSFLILNFLFDVFDAVRALNLKGDCLAGESLDEDLHSSSESQHQMKGGFLLDVVVSECPAILQLLAGEDEPLLIGWDSFLVLNFLLDVLDAVRALDLEGDCLAGESLDEDLHASSEPEDQVKGGLLLDVIVGECPAVLQLLAGEDEPLLIRWDSFLILDFLFDILDAVRALNLKGNCLAGESLYEDLHASSEPEDQVESGFLLDVIVGECPAVF